MTAETDLLPLPERFSFMEWETHMRTYARACVSSATEVLRAEVERLKGLVRSVGYETLTRAEQAEARAERLAEVLREARSYVAMQAEGHPHAQEVLGQIDAALEQETTT